MSRGTEAEAGSEATEPERRWPGQSRARFAELHRSGCFVIPNPWDVGSARLLEGLGFQALATTSAGLAQSLGKRDQEVTLDELTRHVDALVSAVAIPVHVDSEQCFADTPEGVAATVERLASVGASGLSIEDYSPVAGAIEPIEVFLPRVQAAAEAAHRHGMLLTARAENALYGAGDLADSIARLQWYRDAGADVVYAPGLSDLADIGALVDAVGVPVNVLLWGDAFTPEAAAAVGVRRLSTGSALAGAAFEAASLAASVLPSGPLG